jgi:hypothetical protein
MKKALLLLAVFVMGTVFFVTCQSSPDIRDKDRDKDNEIMARVIRDQQRDDFFDRMSWNEALSSTGPLVNHIKYEKDPRTALCFAFYKNDFEKVDCGFVEHVLRQE